MLPGVIESITGEMVSVRIYAAPEYGCWMEYYPLHKKVAVNVPLGGQGGRGRFGCSADLQRLAAEGLLGAGDAALPAEVRARRPKPALEREPEGAT